MAAPVSEATAEFGKRVRVARSGAGYSQEAFANACGLDRSFMGHIERGEKNPTLTTILRITAALHVEPGELLDGILRPPR